MYKSSTKSFASVREYLDNIPVIETHEHYAKHSQVDSAMSFILDGNMYYQSDYFSAGAAYSFPEGASKKEQYEAFIEFYLKSDKTAYARATQEGLRKCWGIEKIDDFAEFEAFEEKVKKRDESVYFHNMEKYKIKAKIVDDHNLMDYVEGKTGYSEYCRFAFPLPPFHDIHNAQDLFKYQKYLDRRITCLDDYLESFDNCLKKCVEFGIVCFKDQSAYRRTLAYGNPGRAEAEKIFNEIIFNPRNVYGDDSVRILDDWLFQYAIRKAASLNLPVQLHTGHMAGLFNEINKANAALLIPTIEKNLDVKFALFHGNWPFMDEYLFIGKNYPNVYLDLCWVQSIDPIYCVELMKRAVMTVPHSKIFAFGGDCHHIEWVVGYLIQAKDNVACALAELVDSGWLNLDEAKQIGLDWFYNNPNEFYKLGL